jgi:hypothetical protein
VGKRIYRWIGKRLAPGYLKGCDELLKSDVFLCYEKTRPKLDEGVSIKCMACPKEKEYICLCYQLLKENPNA